MCLPISFYLVLRVQSYWYAEGVSIAICCYFFSREEGSEIAFFRYDDGKTGGMSPAQCLCGIYAPAWIGVSF